MIRLAWFAAIVVVGLGIWIAVFFHKTDAPITHGEIEFHVPYKHNPFEGDLELDIYHPTNDQVQTKYPVLMYIHGGAWIAGSKLTVNNNRFNTAFNRLRAEGYFIISPDYTLAKNGETPFPDCIEDTFAALRWVEENADTYQFDLDRLGLLGESAGAHLAMMMTYSEPKDFGKSFEKPNIQYLIDVYGPSNFSALYHAATTDSINALINRLPASLAERLDLSRLLVGFDPKEQPKKAEGVMQNLSPTTYIDKEKVPTLIIHGKADQIVPVEQSYLLAGLFDSLEIPYEAHYFEGVNHAFQDATEEQKQTIQQLIIDFVLKQ